MRAVCCKLIEKLANLNGNKKYSRWLLPESKINDMLKNLNHLTNYKNAISMIVALVVMTFTNFLLDAPLTIYFTNKLNERTKLGGKDE